MKILLLICILLLLCGCSASPDPTMEATAPSLPPEEPTTLPTEEPTTEATVPPDPLQLLLESMTLEERVGQPRMDQEVQYRCKTYLLME